MIPLRSVDVGIVVLLWVLISTESCMDTLEVAVVRFDTRTASSTDLDSARRAPNEFCARLEY